MLVAVEENFDQLLRKEKDEASLTNRFLSGFAECLHSPFCRSLEVFLFLKSSSFALVSQW
jgi:hypothetical protein